MKNHLNTILCVAACLLLVARPAGAQNTIQSYSVSLPYDSMTLVVNQLNNGSNTANVVIPNPGMPGDSLRDGDCLYVFNCVPGSGFFPGSYTVYTIDSYWPTGYGDPTDSYSVPPPVLNPGIGFIYYNLSGITNSITFTGTPNIPVLPVSLACGEGSYYLLGRQTNDVGTYENVTGYTPALGSQVVTLRNGEIPVTNTYTGAAWSLGTPGLPVGQSAWFFIPSGSVSTFAPTNILISPANPVIGVGTNVAFTATGHFSNGSSNILAATNGLLWASSSPSMATINSKGVATGLISGTTTITATDGSVSNITTMTVHNLSLAQPTSTYLFTGSATNITLAPGDYVITAYGAQGGAIYGGWSGGLGAEMEAHFYFATSTTLTLLVGGVGGASYTDGGGGGGSFVVNGNNPLIIAGGGGGAVAIGNSSAGAGSIGSTNNSGSVGPNGGGAGGAAGAGGTGGVGPYGSGGGGGGGFYSGGSASSSADGGGGGGSFVSGGFGGFAGSGGGGGNGSGGGYGGGGGGGGGGSDSSGGYSGGGGGGYSGGGGGGWGGGGGGSYIDASAITNLVEATGIASPDDSPNGEIIIRVGSVVIPALTNIVISPANPIIVVGAGQAFDATGYVSDGSVTNLTSTNGLVWSSSNPAVATINSNGVTTGLASGTTTISATDGSVSGNMTLTVQLPGSPQTNQFLYIGSETSITLAPGVYKITAYGAQGGSSYYGGSGGMGAEMEGEFYFSGQTALTILVGGAGSGGGYPNGGGGGGGSFIVQGNTPLVIGGGGGGSDYGATGSGLTTANGGANYGGLGGTGGTGGGNDGDTGGGGGGGFNSNGTPGVADTGGGGFGFIEGGAAGSGGPIGGGGGGYGGGGGGGFYGGGGGGGYSGGGGGSHLGGGGGGSIIDSSAITNLAEVSGIASPSASPNGEIDIVFVPGVIPPGVTNEPASYTVPIGGSATFTVGASGTALSYQWQLAGTNLVGATNNTLMLSNVQSSQAGVYNVIVANSLTSVTSSNAILTVFNPAAPSIYVNSNLVIGSASALGGATITLTPGFTGGIIFYSLTGPGFNGDETAYTGPFTVTNSVVINAFDYSSDFTQSADMQPLALQIISPFFLTTSVLGGGTITLNPNATAFASNSVVTLTAVANPNWAFNHWQGALTSTNNPLTVTLTSNLTLQAVFTPTAFALTLTTAGGGTVSAGGQTTDGVYFATNSLVTLTATNFSGWTFLDWQGALTSTSNPATLVMTQPLAVQGVFGTSITTNAVGGGQIVLSTTNLVPYGSNLIVSSVAGNGNYLAAWSGAAGGNTNPVAATITNANAAISALFLPLPANKFSLSVAVLGNGSATVSPSQSYYSPGTTVTLIATPNNPSVTFYGWTGADNDTNLTSSITLATNSVVYANFLPPAPPAPATATAGISGGALHSASITSGGSRYLSTPVVTLFGGGGSGATATAVLQNGQVVALNILNPGSGYTSAPQVVIEPPVVVTPQAGLAPATFLTFSNLTVSVAYLLQQYVNPAWVTLTNSITATNSLMSLWVNGPVNANNYRLLATPLPATATAVPITAYGFLVAATVTSGGSGYPTPPSVSITGGGGSGATATTTISNGVVASIVIVNPGRSYTSLPSLTIAAPPLTGISAQIQPGFLLQMNNLMPNQIYQLQSASQLNHSWQPVGNGAFLTTSTNQSQYVLPTNQTGFYLLQYLP